MPTWVVMAVYLVSELDLSPLELVLMGTAMEAAVFLFEIPTGVVADMYGRKLSLIIGFIGMGVAWMAVGLVSAPWLIIALWAFWGLSYTFTSGAYEAWITDEVGFENVGSLFPARPEDQLRRRSCRARPAGRARNVVAQGRRHRGRCDHGCRRAAVHLPDAGDRLPAAAARGAGSAVREFGTTAAGGARFAWAQRVVLLLIAVQLFMGMSSEAFDRLKEAHFLRDVGLPAVGDLDPVIWFGIFWLAGLLLGFVAIGRLIKRVERGGRETITRFLFAFTAMELVTMLVFALTGSVWVAIAALLGVFFARDLAGPLYTTWLNEQITDSSVRATVLSISGQANAIGQAAGGPVLGAIGNVWGIRAALAGGAIVIAPALGLYARAMRHGGKEPELEELPATVA